MKYTSWRASLLAAALLALLPLTHANAQATRTWVSGVGDDANPCSRTAPCKTFAGAISKTAAGGEISVLDPGGYGAVTITKSISIINDYSGEAGILASGTNGITVNAAATDIVILRGLVIDGAPPATPGLNGIRFLNGAALHVEKTLIKNFVSTTAGNGNGILFAPTGTAELYVTDTTFINNGAASGATTGGGIFVQPTGSGAAFVSVNRVRLQNNRFGMQISTASTTGTVTASVESTEAVGGTANGFSAVTAAAAGPAANLTVHNSAISGNNSALVSNGATAVIRVGSSLLTGNNTVAVVQNNGQILSYKNNQVDGNTNNSTPITGVGLN
jgi:hypothetical protein